MAYAGLRAAGQQYGVGARTAGDDAFGAFVLAEMGVDVSEAGGTAERVALILTAIDNAPRTLPLYSQSFLYLHKAEEALSRDGGHQRAGRALNRAASHWERHTESEDPDWFLLRAGQVERATSALETSVNRAAPCDMVVRTARLAEARLAGNDLDGALDAANRGAELLEDKVSSMRALDRPKEFSARLEPNTSVPGVREFPERLKALPVAS